MGCRWGKDEQIRIHQGLQLGLCRTLSGDVVWLKKDTVLGREQGLSVVGCNGGAAPPQCSWTVILQGRCLSSLFMSRRREDKRDLPIAKPHDWLERESRSGAKRNIRVIQE